LLNRARQLDLTDQSNANASPDTKEHTMNSITTYLHFDGNCRAAMAFYRDVFGGELDVMTYPDASGQPNTDSNARLMHSQLARGGQTLLMASDSPSGTDRSIPDNNFSVFIECSSNDELERLFAALSQDGTVTTPPSDMPSGRFGMCDDAFGISWILNSAQS
jgi:PhnB protein